VRSPPANSLELSDFLAIHPECLLSVGCFGWGIHLYHRFDAIPSAGLNSLATGVEDIPPVISAAVRLHFVPVGVKAPGARRRHFSPITPRLDVSRNQLVAGRF